ncbi:TonB-dependent receptor [Muricauda sp. SCSIO 64092]|uniref:SusC/RagA family TonB-linked outer membrane protein n=1 Tax=Allomuricauda sp. SCSIO 64092 TaxID=2908842 RepID=UPI001FF2AAE4|nr:TonB-dependent receptor [Muricauda sp. SCSIO 64092]UOY05123.1 TonB-dependent receptor [Muricauda sp. SCSIO 64092]
MKQSIELGFFSLKKKTRTLPKLLLKGVLAMLMVFGVQGLQAKTKTNSNGLLPLQTTVSGMVTDSNGAPLPGANVIVKGTTNGTQTDFDGNYTITTDSDAVLVFSYIGFATQEIPINGQSTIDVQLLEDANKLDEVVIIGYQAQTRGDLTGSVASIDVSEATKQPLVNVAEALEGRATGVSITNNGAPGAAPVVRIRGLGTPNNNNPLYIIDGAQTQDPDILNTINPQDIAQINVLKDGAAAIYGARASNGVIIVTTKSGSYNQDKLSVTVDISTGFSRANRLPDMTNARELGEVFFESLTNDAIRTGGDPEEIVIHPQYFPTGGSPQVPSQLLGVRLSGTQEEVIAPVKPGGTNWLDEIFRTAPTQNITATFSNGNETSKYSATFGYLNREGILSFTGFKRGQVRLNSEFKIGKRLTIGEHLNVSFSNSQNNNFGDQVQFAMRLSPLVPVRDNLGRFAGAYANPNGLSNATNPVANLTRDGDDFFKQTRILGDIYASYELMDGLSFKTSFGGDISILSSRDFRALDPESAEPRSTNTLTERNQQTYSWVWTNTLNYAKTFGDHSVNAVLGYEAVENTGKSLEVLANGFLFETPDFYLLDNASGTPIVDPADTFDFENTLSSVFGTVNYSYADRYLFSATVRRDQSSRFFGDNQSGFFPAFSGGWVISNEDFFPQDGLLNRLKFKASWGQLGNQELPASNPTINISNLNIEFADYAFNGGTNLRTGALLSNVGNPDLTWEITESFNVGAEVGLFDNALGISLEYFRNTTEDLIVENETIISDTAIDARAPFVNTGNVQNTGFDLNISYQNRSGGDFTYGIDLNLSTFENEVTELDGFLLGDTFRGGPITRTEEGQPLSSFFGRVVDGIYRSEAEVAVGPDQGFASNAAGVGRLRYRDLNGDGVINDDDRTFIGNPHPDFTFGLNFNANYKNWDFSVFFSGVVGNDIYNYDKIFTDFPTFPSGNRSTRVLDAFNPSTNPNGSQPGLSFTILNGETNTNSFLVEDGSFVRLKNLVVGYTLPSQLTDKWGIASLRFYANASNLFTITGYDGIDPEIQPINPDGAPANTALTIGVDESTFPVPQIFLLGVNLKL